MYNVDLFVNKLLFICIRSLWYKPAINYRTAQLIPIIALIVVIKESSLIPQLPCENTSPCSVLSWIISGCKTEYIFLFSIIYK